MRKILYFRNPLSGQFQPVSDLDGNFRLELRQKVIKGGRCGISWEKDNIPGMRELKKKLVLKMSNLVLQYKELDGCDYVDSCLNCDRDIETECPDTQRGLAWKMRQAERSNKVKALKQAGATNSEIAKKFKIDERTVRRDLGGK